MLSKIIKAKKLLQKRNHVTFSESLYNEENDKDENFTCKISKVERDELSQPVADACLSLVDQILGNDIEAEQI